MAVSKRLRFEIFRRDNHTCRYCGASAPGVELEADHVVPRTLGGTDEPSNLVTSCVDCNAGKSSVPADAKIVEDVSQDAVRWSAAMAKAADIQRKSAAKVELAVGEYAYAWEIEWSHVEMWVEYAPDAGWHYTGEPDRKYNYVIRIYDRRTEEDSTGRLFDTEGEADKYVSAELSRNVPLRPKDWRKSAKAWFAAGLAPEDFQEIVRGVVEDRGYVNWDNKWAYTAGVCWNVIKERQAVAAALLAAEEERA